MWGSQRATLTWSVKDMSVGGAGSGPPPEKALEPRGREQDKLRARISEACQGPGGQTKSGYGEEE